MLKRLLLFAFVLPCLGLSAQNKKAEQKYEEFTELVKSRRFESGAELLKKIIGMKMPVYQKVDYTLRLGVLYKDSLLNYTEAMKYFEQAHALEPKLAKEKNVPFDEYTNAIATHLMISEMSDTLKEYKRMQEANECGLRFYESVIAPKIPSDYSDYDLALMHAMLYANLGNSFGKQGKYDEGAANFDKSLQIFQNAIDSPSGEPILYTMKWSYRIMYSLMYSKMKGDKQKAYEIVMQNLPEFQAAINMKDEDLKATLELQGPMFIFNFANAAYEVENYEQCVQFCTDALTWPNRMYDPIIIDKQGQAFLKLGREEEARECWTKVKAIIPDYFDDNIPVNPLRDMFGR